MQALTKLIAVVGGKHSGKTTVIENLITELKHRGFRVGAVKEMVKIPTLDTPAKETDRYKTAGAEIIVAVPRDETVVFIKKQLSLKEILPYLERLDFVILEGFENEQGLLKIIAAKTSAEAKTYMDAQVIALSGLLMESEVEKKKAEGFGVLMFNGLTQAKALADLVEQKAVSFS